MRTIPATLAGGAIAGTLLGTWETQTVPFYISGSAAILTAGGTTTIAVGELARVATGSRHLLVGSAMVAAGVSLLAGFVGSREISG